MTAFSRCRSSSTLGGFFSSVISWQSVRTSCTLHTHTPLLHEKLSMVILANPNTLSQYSEFCKAASSCADQLRNQTHCLVNRFAASLACLPVTGCRAPSAYPQPPVHKRRAAAILAKLQDVACKKSRY